MSQYTILLSLIFQIAKVITQVFKTEMREKGTSETFVSHRFNTPLFVNVTDKEAIVQFLPRL